MEIPKFISSKKEKLSKKLYILALTSLITSCSVSDNQVFLSRIFNVSSLSSNEIKIITNSSLVKSNNTFGIKLFVDIVKEQKKQNVFISPANAALSLQMVYNGVNKENKDEMKKTLGLGILNLEEVNQLNELLIKKLKNPASDINLEIGTSLWTEKNKVNLDRQFKNNIRKVYNADVNEIDLHNNNSIYKINSWVSENTNKTINKIIDKIPTDMVSYLINVIYFKSNWTDSFKKEETVEKDFILANGVKKKVSLMSSFRNFRYYSNYNNYSNTINTILPENRFEGAEITYGKDKKVSLYLFLPDEKSSLENFYTKLNNENLEKWFQGFYNIEGYISFPKFKIKWEKELKVNLSNLGMKSTFNSLANFTKNDDSILESLFISSMLQSTFIDVNEDGNENLLVSSIKTANTSSSQTPRFVADRPFLYLIRDNETKSILFMGVVNEPKYG